MLTQGRHQHQPKDTNVVLAVRSLECGSYRYMNNELVYLPEVEWGTREGLAKFVKGTLVVVFKDYECQKRIEIPYRIIEAIVISTQPPALTLTLWEAPRLFQVEDQSFAQLMASLGVREQTQTPPRTRLCELPHSTQSHRIICGQSLVYRLIVSSAELAEKAKRLLDLDIFSISHYNFLAPPLQEHKSLIDGVKSFNRAIQNNADIVPFSVLYQLEALVKNGFLLPWTVERLLIRMVGMMNDKQNTAKEEAAKVSTIHQIIETI
jgi:hypothetical protein